MRNMVIARLNVGLINPDSISLYAVPPTDNEIPPDELDVMAQGKIVLTTNDGNLLSQFTGGETVYILIADESHAAELGELIEELGRGDEETGEDGDPPTDTATPVTTQTATETEKPAEQTADKPPDESGKATEAETEAETEEEPQATGKPAKK